MKKNKKAPELTEDIEVIGPGQMLAEAREKISLSQQEVADKLNFRLALVRDIEADNFDKSLPATYNRGYLRNYAKLVDISVDEVLASYEMLGVAETQGAEMQSFSKITEKQAQNNRLMWVTYLILAVLIGSTLLWWIQGMELGQQSAPVNTESTEQPAQAVVANEQSAPIESNSAEPTQPNQESENISSPGLAQPAQPDEKVIAESPTLQVGNTEAQPSELSNSINTNDSSAQDSEAAPSAQSIASEQLTKQVVFNFAGDCWVNIYDATGERIAWGVKKAGYEMTISGIAPFKITLGKPELVQINYDGQNVDMSQFNVGNIAKFDLPLES